MEQKKALKYTKVAAMIVVASFIRAIAVHSFILPNDFAPGGVTGIAAMIQYKFPFISSGYTIVILNIPLLILAYKYLGKTFALLSVLTTVLTSGLLVLFDFLPDIYQYRSETDRLLPAIASGILSGTALAITFKAGGSSGGTDIVGMLINKKFSATNVAWFIFACDATVVLTSYFVYGNFEAVLIAWAEMFVSSKVIETIIQGFKNALKYEIVTARPKEIADLIFKKVGRGVTCIPAKGMFTDADKSLLICIVRKRQVPAFNALLKEHASDAFVYISRTSEVIGLGFK